MKKMAFAALMILLYFTAGATKIDTFTQGQVLTVMAQSGLKMRILPGQHHEHFKVISYGEKVHVVHVDNSQIVADRIDWSDGHWITVSHDGDIGYVFDGFLSPLPLPRFEYEFVQFDMDLIYPLESWVAHHFFEVKNSDTLIMANLTKVTQHFEAGNSLTKINTGHIYKSELTISDIRIMDAYHLLQGMLTTKQEIERFREKSIFIESREGEVKHIKINLDNPIDIKTYKNNQVVITLRSTAYECSL